MHKDLTSFINKYYKVKSNSSEFSYAWTTMILYMVGSLSAYEYQDRMKILRPKKSTKKIRLALISSGYTFNAKMALLEAVKQKTTITSIQEKWEITDRDCRKLEHDISDPDIAKCIRKRLKGIPKNFVFNWQSVFAEIHSKIKIYIKFLVRKKLTFVANSHSVHISEYFSELEENAVRTFYKVWPTTISTQHLINYINRGVHNRVINIIKSETTLKRGRLIKVGGTDASNYTFSLLESSATRLSNTSNNDSYDGSWSYDEYQSESDRHEGAFKFEMQISIKQILEKYKRFPKKYSYLLILLGTEDANFTKWLRQHRIAHINEDNVDVQERISTDEFNKHLSNYFHLKEETSTIFLMKIKRQLGYENDAKRLTT